MKRRDFLADYFLYSIVKFLAYLFRLLPLRLSLWVGRRLGDILYYLIGRRKSVACANLKAAFRGRYSSDELRKIIRSEYQSLSQSFIEVLKFPLFDDGYINEYIKVEGEDKIATALKKGRGAILLTAHFGNWELSSLVGALKGYKMNVLARWQKFERLNGYLNMMRSSKGANVIFKEDAREQIMRALNANEVVGILSDQDGGKRGEFVEFFDRSVSTPKGVAHFSLRTGAPIFPVFIIREKGPYHRIVVEDDISATASEDTGKNIHEILQRFATLLQKYVEEYPGQWLWLHKRWKSTPTKYVLVLSDGKAGHLRQSLSIANAIKEERIKSGYGQNDTKIETLEVRFRNDFTRTIFELLSFSGFNLHLLPFCFSSQIFDKIESAYADYIVSCGSSLAGVSLSLKRQFNAKSVVIMRPNIYNIDKYDLAIIPAHDRPKHRQNVVVVRGAVADFNRESLKERANELKERARVAKDNVIGVLIGGDSKAYYLNPELVNGILDGVLLAAEDLDADILLTTSRRTSASVEKAIKERLADLDRIKLLLIANENNFDGAVEGILGLSDVLIASGESMAMVSEAVNSGKRVLVFIPQRKRPSLGAKQELALKDFEEQRLITISDPNSIRTDVCSLAKERPKTGVASDMDLVRLTLKKII